MSESRCTARSRTDVTGSSETVSINGWCGFTNATTSGGISTASCTVWLVRGRRSFIFSTGRRHGRQFAIVTFRITFCTNWSHVYNLRPRSHSFSLTAKTDSRKYINRMLFNDIYYSSHFIVLYTVIAFCQSVLLKMTTIMNVKLMMTAGRVGQTTYDTIR